MATGSLYGSTSESTGLYGIGAASGGTYFEWFIFQDSATAPATPTGGSWSFSTNTGTAPSGWVVSPPPAPVNQVWVSIAVVDSRSTATFTWSVPGLLTGSGLPILSASGVPSAGTGLNGQLYINTATTPQSLYFKQGGAWTQLTGSNLYATAGANTNITSLTGITGAISTPTSLQLSTAGGGADAVAKLHWNTTFGGPTIGLVGGNTNLQIGQDEFVYVHNNTGSTITKGQVVYISGSQGQRLTVALAQANADATSISVIGFANESIANNADGFVATVGLVSGINTSGFADGAVIWLSPTVAGGFTVTKPVAPNHLVLLGYVVKGNSVGAGSIYVFTQNGYELDELHDVLITSVANGNYLRYNSAIPAWVNVAGPTGTLVGTTDTQTLTNKTISGASNTLTNIGNASLSNSSITVNGTGIALGGSGVITANTPNSLSFGTGLSATGSFNGSAATSVQLQAVGTAGVYGSAGQTPTITTNSTGQITSIVLNNTTVNAANIVGPISVNAANITGVLPITSGGTNASTASGARINLGLGSIATQDASNVSITGGVITGITDLAIADGGTGASTASDARTNLGLGTLATQNSNSVSITGGSVSTSALTGNVSIANGGTGADNIVTARTNLGLGTIATYNAAVANGAATLDASGYLTNSQIPPSIVSGTSYRGTWNASTNTPTLVSSVGTQGYYYVVSTAGSTTLNGISTWAVGDWAIFNGTVWQRLTQNTIISGGLINNTPIGSTTPSTGNFTVLTENSSPVVVQTDIGTAPNEIPLNQYLGNLAYQDARSIAGPVGVGGALTVNGTTTITGTATLTANPVLSAGTVNGVAYLNASRVVTTGSALTFDGSKLLIPTGGVESGGAAGAGFFTAYNTDAVNAQRIIVTMSGTNAVLNATRASGTQPQMLFQIDGSEQMRLTTTGLGIGTSSPAYKFDVNGNFRFANFSSGATSGFFGCADTGSITLNFGGTTTPQKGQIFYSDNSDFFSFSTNSTERMRLDSSGNLIQSAPTTPPTLATNGQMVFNLTSNTNLRVSVRGSDGVTRTANITLA